MQRKLEIKKSLCVGPNVMDGNIVKTIVTLFRQKYEKICDESDGFILSIDGIKDLTNIISKDSCHINFTATLDVTTIKPQKGDKIEFKPSLVMQKGIFGKMYDSISLFIPEDYIKEKGWVYNKENDVYENQKNDKIKKDSTIKAVISDIKFVNSTKYNCICRLE
jgi:DNA-directed RNA polymerase subunit E'/Rpb7